jgi:hypothetical protein
MMITSELAHVVVQQLWMGLEILLDWPRSGPVRTVALFVDR